MNLGPAKEIVSQLISLRNDSGNSDPLERLVISDVVSFEPGILTHPDLEPEISNLRSTSKNLGSDIGLPLVRHSFLLICTEIHLQDLFNHAQTIVAQAPDIKPDHPSKGRDFIYGRTTYPLFASISATLSSAHASMSESITLIGKVYGNKNWEPSISWANSPEGKKKVLEIAGRETLHLVESAWIWAEELKNYRNAIHHVNPQQTQGTVEFRSSNGEKYDSITCLIPLNPKTSWRTEPPKWGKDALRYCTEIKDKCFAYNRDLISLMDKHMEMKNQP